MQQGIAAIMAGLLTFKLAVGASAAVLEVRQDAATQTAPTSSPPKATPYDWTAGAVSTYPIHLSCNYTERAQLQRGIKDAIALATHARDHIFRFGNSSQFYSKYFGQAPTAEVIGWYDRIVSADRAGIAFRCDDIDGNCAQPGWGGHWRGENATDETVICPLSYETRKPLDAMCGFGYTVASGALNFYFGSDLIHRLYHLPKIGEAIVEHYADSYTECLALAKEKPEEAVRNSHTLQYFALDVYAFDVALPGEGCTGKPKTTAAASAGQPTATTGAAPSTTATAGKECHTHANGEQHCV